MPAEKKQRAILFEFTKVNKRIWVLGAQQKDIRLVNGNLPPASVRQSWEVIFTVEKPMTVIIHATRISYDSSVSINDKPIGTALNAVIAENGDVKIGAFVRDFD
jgi:hypothetical protein